MNNNSGRDFNVPRLRFKELARWSVTAIGFVSYFARGRVINRRPPTEP
jgi:hypothetical protein